MESQPQNPEFRNTVKAPNIAHLSILTSVGYNKKETNLKKIKINFFKKIFQEHFQSVKQFAEVPQWGASNKSLNI